MMRESRRRDGKNIHYIYESAKDLKLAAKDHVCYTVERYDIQNG